MTNKFLPLIITIADLAARRGVYAPNDAELSELIKTARGYYNAMLRAVVGLFNRKIDEFEFVGRISDIIRDQMRRAYNEGLRRIGIDPKNMTSAMQAELSALITNEETFALALAADILKQRDIEGATSAQFKSRLEVWRNRYDDVANRAAVTGAEKKGYNLEWRIGATEKSCKTCLKLNGKVATAAQWRISQYKPQSPPNAELECGGWRCDCKLDVTDRAATVPADGAITI